MSVTETGKTCVSWADPDYIYSGDDLNDFARKSSSYSVINRFRDDNDYQPGDFTDGVLPKNYCRSPLSDPEGRPWCFTDHESEEWEYCDVHRCADDGEYLQALEAGTTYEHR